MSLAGDQQFCLRWNNFQANITSQFETLRDDEDFTDVTIACEGQRLQGHKVVLSACSPFFKELFKTNPCSHPIIFMRDVEARHIIALMEFMYAGEVNIAQAHLSTFLKTAESLKIRGLTDTSADFKNDGDTLFSNHQKSSILKNNLCKTPAISSSSTVTSSQDIPDISLPNESSPPLKRVCKSEPQLFHLKKEEAINPFAFIENCNQMETLKSIQPKVELPDYLSDEGDEDVDENETDGLSHFYPTADLTELPGGVEVTPQITGFNGKDVIKQEPFGQGTDIRKLHSLDPRPCDECGKIYSNLSNLRQHMRLIHYPTYVQCSFCHKQFKTDLYLRRHIMSAHSGLNIGYFKTSMPNDIRTFHNIKYFDVNAIHKNNVPPKYDRVGIYSNQK
nr:protein abrupt-like isoform X1 [Leptinotarsa decemlineata]